MIVHGKSNNNSFSKATENQLYKLFRSRADELQSLRSLIGTIEVFIERNREKLVKAK